MTDLIDPVSALSEMAILSASTIVVFAVAVLICLNARAGVTTFVAPVDPASVPPSKDH